MYTIEEKTNIFLCFQEQDLPIDLVNKIWNMFLDIRKDDIECPKAPKKEISTRTKNMMERWRHNGIWIRHVRNIQLE